MLNISLDELCRLLDVENTLPDMPIKHFCFKEEFLKENSAYFAIVTENFDGYKFNSNKIKELNCVVFSAKKLPDVPCIVVENTILALYKIAKYYRDKFENFKSITVTGSIGKTSAKEMILSVLNANAKTLANRASVNGTQEICRMISNLEHDVKYFLMELGLRAPTNPFSWASQILRPNMGVITNIGHSHIENFKNKEHILEHKLSMADYMPDDGILFLNGDDELLFKSKYKFKTIFFAIKNKNADFIAENINYTNNYITFNAVSKDKTINYPLKLNVVGEHNILNALAAFAIGLNLGIPIEQIAKGIADFRTKGFRQHVVKGHKNNIVIADCYNATPESMISGFEMLKNTECKGRKIAVLGHMMRLGKRSEELHRKTGKDVSEYNFDLILTYGPDAYYICDEAKRKNQNAIHFYTKEDLLNYLKEYVQEEDTVLFKGVEKFHNFQDLYYGFMGLDKTYYGKFADDDVMHSEAESMYFGDSENYYIGKSIHKRVKIKDLTLIFAIEAILKRVNLYDEVIISKDASQKHAIGTNLRFSEGNIFSVDDLLHAVLFKSSFEAFYALCEHAFGSPRKLLQDVEETINKLRLVNTKISAFSKRENDKTYTSAYDLFKFIKYALKKEKFLNLIQDKEYVLKNLKTGKETLIGTNNKLLIPETKVQYINYYSEKAIGIKAENIYTNDNEIKNHSLISCVKNGDDFVIGIILGSFDFRYCNNSYIDMKRILEKIEYNIRPPYNGKLLTTWTSHMTPTLS